MHKNGTNNAIIINQVKLKFYLSAVVSGGVDFSGFILLFAGALLIFLTTGSAEMSVSLP